MLQQFALVSRFSASVSQIGTQVSTTRHVVIGDFPLKQMVWFPVRQALTSRVRGDARPLTRRPASLTCGGTLQGPVASCTLHCVPGGDGTSRFGAMMGCARQKPSA